MKRRTLVLRLAGHVISIAITIYLVILASHAVDLRETVRVLKPQSERLTTYCMTLREETRQTMRDVDRDAHSRELALLEWPALAAYDWRSLRPCLLDVTPVEPECYPGEIDCARQQAWFAYAHFEYGFLP